MFIAILLAISAAIQLNAMEESTPDKNTDTQSVEGSMMLRNLINTWAGSPQAPSQIPWMRLHQTKGPTIPWQNFSNPLNEENEKDWQKVISRQEVSLEILEITGELDLDIFLAELKKAERKFEDSYVRMVYFLASWPSVNLDKSIETRRQIMDTLLSKGMVELFNNTSDGELAIRSVLFK